MLGALNVATDELRGFIQELLPGRQPLSLDNAAKGIEGFTIGEAARRADVRLEVVLRREEEPSISWRLHAAPAPPPEMRLRRSTEILRLVPDGEKRWCSNIGVLWSSEEVARRAVDAYLGLLTWAQSEVSDEPAV